MPSKAMPVKEAARLAEKVAADMGVELVDVELVKEPTGHYLRFYIDREGGIALNEIETFHRAIRPLVERVEYDFMEVSSPGADRPLKTERDFERAKGMDVEVKTYRAVNGAKRFLGVLAGLEDDCVVIEDAGGEALRFARKDVAVVRPWIEFDEEDLRDEAPAE